MRTVDWCLTRQLFEHFGSTCESIAGFADRDVEDEFLDTKFPHGICVFIFLGVRLANAGQHGVEQHGPLNCGHLP